MKRLIACLIPLFLVSSLSYAEEKKSPVADQPNQATATDASKDSAKDAKPDPKAPYAAALFKLIEETQGTIHDAMQPVETELANEVEKTSKQLLADNVVYGALLKMAMYRDTLNGEESNPERAARSAMGSLQSMLRQTPGVMSNEALINRARLVAQVSKYYSKKDPSLCRYYPQDFSILLSVDAPWLTDVDEDVARQAMSDELKAIKAMLEGMPPLIINDTDVQTVFSKFAGEWLGGLDKDTVRIIAVAKAEANYCELWRYMLEDVSKMTEAYPSAGQKLLLPMLTLPTRGWLDVGQWSYRVGNQSQAAPDDAAGSEASDYSSG
ncbi:hypothetical protein IFT48_00965 [Pseudomonas fluorescens]|uniref:hypothetical protein n=1 Tax=Pseudomonas fluorescens TaxID=294 RepID=UPI001930C09B|nr:hypothetical protein [Pseudomonas fluorescens]MBD8088563.1 hypothetical protein [Pseudomonas fluorescens]